MTAQSTIISTIMYSYNIFLKTQLGRFMIDQISLSPRVKKARLLVINMAYTRFLTSYRKT